MNEFSYEASIWLNLSENKAALNGLWEIDDVDLWAENIRHLFEQAGGDKLFGKNLDKQISEVARSTHAMSSERRLNNLVGWVGEVNREVTGFDEALKLEMRDIRRQFSLGGAGKPEVEDFAKRLKEQVTQAFRVYAENCLAALEHMNLPLSPDQVKDLFKTVKNYLKKGGLDPDSDKDIKDRLASASKAAYFGSAIAETDLLGRSLWTYVLLIDIYCTKNEKTDRPELNCKGHSADKPYLFEDDDLFDDIIEDIYRNLKRACALPDPKLKQTILNAKKSAYFLLARNQLRTLEDADDDIANGRKIVMSRKIDAIKSEESIRRMFIAGGAEVSAQGQLSEDIERRIEAVRAKLPDMKAKRSPVP